jgi:hypothetical protein
MPTALPAVIFGGDTLSSNPIGNQAGVPYDLKTLTSPLEARELVVDGRV